MTEQKPIQLAAHDQCTGCGGCADRCPRHCIAMQPDTEGFLCPVIDNRNCVHCHLCEKSCPVLHPVERPARTEQVYAAWALDDAIRNSSSSGGVFSCLARAILREGGAVNGAVFDSDMTLTHRLITAESELAELRGSRYVQSEARDIYKEVEAILQAGRPVLFTSTPCQVAALRRFLKQDYEKLYTCDLICHGVPSGTFFKQYLKSIAGLFPEKIVGYVFRDPATWKFTQFVRLASGARQPVPRSCWSYIHLFVKGFTYRRACYQCVYASERRIGDITLGDFWGIGSQTPFRHPVKSGVSLMLVNTAKGQQLAERIGKDCFMERRMFEEAAACNHQLRTAAACPPGRETIYADLPLLPPQAILKKYRLERSLAAKVFSRVAGIIARIRPKRKPELQS